MPDPREQDAADLKVQNDALIVAQQQRDLATRWAQYLGLLIQEFFYGARVSEGGMLEAVRQAREAGFDPDIALSRLRRGEDLP